MAQLQIDTLGRTRYSYDNIKMDLKELETKEWAALI
jgi:hypothetical protein